MRILILIVWALVLGVVSAAEVDRGELEQALAALTDDHAVIHRPAMRKLARIGAPALPDLAVLAEDRDAGTRMRVARVTAVIGDPDAMPILRRLGRDPDGRVRETAALALGMRGGVGAYAVLRPLLQDRDPEVREAAALALGQLGDARALRDLVWWPIAGGRTDRLQLDPDKPVEPQIDEIREAMKTALIAILSRPHAVPSCARLLGELDGDPLHHLLEATWQMGDTRLVPALVAILDDNDDRAVERAATSLAANGDSRVIGPLCRLAADDGRQLVRDAAARTLRRLTGYHAAPGRAWELWWQRHADQVASLAGRDRFLARLHDASVKPGREELAAFTPTQLEPLIDGVLGQGAAYWAPLALRALRRDDPTRWTPYLVRRYTRTLDEPGRVGVVLILEDLGDPAAVPHLQAFLDELEQVDVPDETRHPRGSLRAALRLALAALTPAER